MGAEDFYPIHAFGSNIRYSVAHISFKFSAKFIKLFITIA